MSTPSHDDRVQHDCPGPEHCPLPFDARTTSIFEAIPLGVFIMDASGAPVFANRQSTRLLGLGPVRGLQIEDLSAAYAAYVAGTDEPYPVERLPIVKALHGERGFQNDIEIRRKDGRVYLEVEAAPVFDSKGEVMYAVALFRDTTATRVMEAELSGLAASLESRAIAQEARLEKVKSTSSVNDLVADIAAALREAREDARVARNALSLFLANFSHELRTPLNHIIGFSDLIDQKIAKGVTDGIDRHAANIRQSGSSLLETLNRIIRFAEMETGAHDEPELEIFVADDLLSTVADWAAPLAEQRSNQLRLTIAEPIGTMRSDSSFIEAALRQIVENACKHSKGGVVEIVGERHGSDADSRVRIVVSDQGPGIDSTLARTLLDGRVSPGDPLATGGLGVGIPLAKKLLDAVDGRLSAESGPGGTRFVVDLPVLLRLRTVRQA